MTGKSHEVKLSIRDLEETITKDDIEAALQKAAGSEFMVTENAMRALRPAYKGLDQTASWGGPKSHWRKRHNTSRPSRLPYRGSYKTKEVLHMLESRHIAGDCTNQINRSSHCLKYGQAGHKIAQCTKDPRCPLCAERDKDHHRIVGSHKCHLVLKTGLLKIM